MGFIDITTLGADPSGVADSGPAIQSAFNTALTVGGIPYAPRGTYLVNTLIVPAYNPGCGTTFTSGAGQSVKLQGDGSYQTILKAGQSFAYTGIFGYGRSGVCPAVAQLDLADLTLDGNYLGAGGTIPQPASGAGALVSLPWPHTAANATAPNGRYHTLRGVRLFRPSGYGTQPTQGMRLDGCEFDTMGQPDAQIHYDNLGSGPGDAIVIGCTWRDGAGNYGDFVDGSPSGCVRLTMVANVSRNHGAGGVYALGSRSVIMGNRLENNTPGSGIGYDSGTNQAIRYGNVVEGNTLHNIAIWTDNVSGNENT